MLEQERRDPGDVGIADAPALVGELVDGGLDVGRVPQRDGVQRQAEGAELLFLFVPMGFPDLATLAVANAPGQAVPELLAGLRILGRHHGHQADRDRLDQSCTSGLVPDAVLRQLQHQQRHHDGLELYRR